MNYSDDDLIPISALAHFSYCPRRCALIHIEQVWVENVFTAEGRIMHQNVHEENAETRGSVKIARGVQLRSLRVGLIGVADVIEYHRTETRIRRPYPVEYKRGRPKPDRCDEVQLCAQAICLEEMHETAVPEGALFYGKTRRRTIVAFDRELRDLTEQTAVHARNLIASGVTPPPAYAKRCESCSLVGTCLPKKIGRKSSVKRYLKNMTACEP
ncbi:MAG: CRISPR-associated protein Cas4 [Desulfobacteraceae bacterium]|nr:CRISPR-associated protein Cas4 [Desulfobacteraceae bacterium]